MRKLKVIGLVASLLLLLGSRAALGVPGAPRAQVAARFKHGIEKHRALSCAECHTLTPERIEVEAFPGHAACVSCHNLASESMTKPRAFCGVCHEARPITRSDPALLRFPHQGEEPSRASDFGMRFSHPAHLKAQAADPACRTTAIKQITLAIPSSAGRTPLCTDCHRRTESPATPEMTLETGHATCFQCHCEQPVKPSGQAAMPAIPSMYDCARCHQLAGAGSPRLSGLVPEFRHQDHELDTRPRRKAEAQRARAADYLCLECHQVVTTAASLGEIKLPEVRQCLACHNGRVGLPDALAKEVVESLRRR
jgi:predicted CXXCH cytochrome family protein